MAMSAVVVVLTIVWPILLNTALAVRSVPPVRREMGHALGLARWERLVKILLPSLVPSITVGVRMAVSISLVATLLVDILGGFVPVRDWAGSCWRGSNSSTHWAFGRCC